MQYPHEDPNKFGEFLSKMSREAALAELGGQLSGKRGKYIQENQRPIALLNAFLLIPPFYITTGQSEVFSHQPKHIEEALGAATKLTAFDTAETVRNKLVAALREDRKNPTRICMDNQTLELRTENGRSLPMMYVQQNVLPHIDGHPGYPDISYHFTVMMEDTKREATKLLVGGLLRGTEVEEQITDMFKTRAELAKEAFVFEEFTSDPTQRGQRDRQQVPCRTFPTAINRISIQCAFPADTNQPVISFIVANNK